jgi:hypothetical protein
MTIKRSSTWLTHELTDYLRQTQNEPFVWGSLDCCLFASGAVQAMTSVDIADDFTGKYTDKASAFALIHTVTGGTTVTDAIAYCAKKYGLNEWLKADGSPCPLKAQRGDLVAVTPENSEDGTVIAGVVDLSGCFVACMGDQSIIRLPLSAIQRAWHIPA